MPQVQPEHGLQHAAALVDHIAEQRLALVEHAPHVKVLRALSREQEGDLWRFCGAYPCPAVRRIRCIQIERSLRFSRRQHGAPVRKVPAPGLQRPGNIRQRLPLVLRNVARQPCLRRARRIGASGRHRQHLPGTARDGRYGDRRFFQHHVRIGSTHAEGAHTRAARRAAGRPVLRLGVDVERTAREVDLRVRSLVVQAGRQRLVPQGEHRLDESGHPRGGVEMADVGLHRTDGAVAGAFGLGAKSLRERGDLDRVAHRRARAVRLDVADAVGRDVRDHLRGKDRLRLPLHAGRGVAHLGRAVVVDGRALDDRVNCVAVGQRIGQALHRHDAHAAAADGTGRTRIKGTAMAIRRSDGPRLVTVAEALPQVQRDTAGQSHVGLVIQQCLAGHVHCHQRGRAGGLHRDRGPLQVELVGHPGAQRVFLVAIEQRLQRRLFALAAQHAGGQQIAPGVLVGARTAVDADAPRLPIAVAAGMLERLDRRFEEEALLRIEIFGLACRIAEEARVETVHAVENDTGLHVVGVGQGLGRHAAIAQFLIGEKTDRLDAAADVAPEGVDIRRTRVAPRQADDGNVDLVDLAGFGAVAHRCIPSAAFFRRNMASRCLRAPSRAGCMAVSSV